MSDTIKPLPCPFCGDPITVNKSGLAVHVSPGKCIIGAMGFASDYILHATRWNTRTAPQVKPGLVAQAVEEFIAGSSNDFYMSDADILELERRILSALER